MYNLSIKYLEDFGKIKLIQIIARWWTTFLKELLFCIVGNNSPKFTRILEFYLKDLVLYQNYNKMCEELKPIYRSYLKINKDYKTYANRPKHKIPLIRLYYGPLEKNGFIKHKPQKLHGLIACLKRLNYDVEVIPAAHLNILKVAILGHDIYRINIKFLEFNMICSFDKMCPIVVQKIQDAVERLYNNQNIAKENAERIYELKQDLSASSVNSSDTSF